MTTYPMTYPNDGDARFTGELIDEIAAVLIAHGFPPAFDDDTVFAGLRDAVHGFLYGPEFNAGDRVSWLHGWADSPVVIYTGTVEAVADTESGPVARIATDPHPTQSYPRHPVVPCKALTRILGGVS